MDHIEVFLTASKAVDEASALLADEIVAEMPELDRQAVARLYSHELWFAVQDATQLVREGKCPGMCDMPPGRRSAASLSRRSPR
jgi:hypothetical protein